MFTAIGHLKIDPVAERDVTRDDGALSGDAFAVGVVRAIADYLEGMLVGPVEGPYTYSDHLRSPVSAVMIVASAFTDDAIFTGDVPERPAIPDGALG